MLDQLTQGISQTDQVVAVALTAPILVVALGLGFAMLLDKIITK